MEAIGYIFIKIGSLLLFTGVLILLLPAFSYLELESYDNMKLMKAKKIPKL